jgi:hypothetical protein
MRRYLLALVLILTAAPLLAIDVEHKFESVIYRGTVQRIVIDVPEGNFTLRTGEPDQLALSGIASRDYQGEREKQWATGVVNDITVEFYVKGSEAIVRRKFGSNAAGWRAKKFTAIDLRLDLPPGIDVKFLTGEGRVDLAGDFGDVDVDLNAGEVHASIPRATIRELKASCRVGEVHANLGTEEVTHEGLFPKKATFYNPGGTSHVNLHTTFGEVHVKLTQ